MAAKQKPDVTGSDKSVGVAKPGKGGGAVAHKPDTLALDAKSGKPIAADRAQAMANLAIRPSVNAAVVVSTFSTHLEDVELGALMNSLLDSMELVSDGDMRQCEAMLLGQAYSLQAIFTSLSRRATNQEYMKNYETFFRLALKAQGQCRATLETLAMLKNPRVVFARQANIAHGPQQVNNGVAPPLAAEASRAGNSIPERNELLEAPSGERMDARTASEAGGVDSALASVGAVNRSKDSSR